MNAPDLPSPRDASLAPSDPTPTAQVIALSELPDPLREAASASVLDGNPLHQVKARLQVSVGETTMTVGELLAAREHQVLVLDRKVDQPVDILLEGRVVARGQLVAVDDQFAVRITELPLPLQD